MSASGYKHEHANVKSLNSPWSRKIEGNPRFILSDYLVLDVIIGHGVRLAWFQDHPGDAYEDQKTLAWQRFYEELPESVARWIVAALRYLVEQGNPSRPRRLSPLRCHVKDAGESLVGSPAL